GIVIFTLTRDFQTQGISIKLQTLRRVPDDNRRVIDTQKQRTYGMLPFRIAFAFGELQNLQVMAIRIPEVKSLDTASILVPLRQALRTGRRMLNLVLAEQAVSLLHVTYDDGNVLEPAIIAARIDWKRPAAWRKIFRQLQEFLTQFHSDDVHAET